jgi:mRNA-degrading endonuclease RelE of RelBE toxin-antitoxin system
MKYNIQFKPRAVKDIERLSSRMQLQIIKGIEAMSDD